METLLTNYWVLTVGIFVCTGGLVYSCLRISRRRPEPDWMYWFWHGLAVSNVMAMSYLLWRLMEIL